MTLGNGFLLKRRERKSKNILSVVNESKQSRIDSARVRHQKADAVPSMQKGTSSI